MSRNFSSDPKGRRFISLAAFVLTILLLVLLNILRLYAKDKFPQYMPDTPAMPVRVISALMIIAAAVYVVFIVILLPMWYKSLRYVINEREIISYSGIFSRTYRIMKLSSVQHAVRVSAPLSGYTGFNFIILKALGGNMPILFLSDKDCGEILELFRIRCEAKPAPEGGKYFVEYSPEDSGYVYTDSSAIFSSEEISDIAEDFGSVRQLSFDELSSEQLSFTDMENGKEEKKQ
ncbi:MAG: PH domain-containing protein [Oscillospiraceae bacterium]|nr:PH domain-containing protein [Oscillospiraceae bacterium]